MAGDEDTNRLYQESLDLHEKYKGKIEISPKVPLETSRDLARAYTPGVAAVCRAIARDHELAYRYTLKANTVAIVTDGSAVLGLGNIGGYAAIPVMEGKALLFKMFAGIDAFPLCFESYQTDFVDQVRNIAPVFGGINLEDIAAPKCFEVEDAALLNACTVTGKDFSDLRIVVSGAGAAGYAIVRLLKCIGYSPDVCQHVREILVCDRQGIIHRNRKGLYANKYKFILADETNQERRMGGLADALEGADVFIGVSAPDLVTGAMIRAMNDDPIVFAMANPVPEVMPDVALAAGAAVVGTGRSDYPNQINNALAFPGVFRGALDAHARVINDEMKVAAAHALARYVESPVKDRIMPLVLDRGVVQAVATAVSEAARYSGAARDIG